MSNSFSEKFRSLRHKVKACMPYVRRREYRIIKQKYEDLNLSLASGLQPATEANLLEKKPLTLPANSDICLFVSFASTPQLKNHVVDHIKNLIRLGIRVVLVVNTDLPPTEIVIDRELEVQLSGIFIRENLGFDFAAWSHIYRLHPDLRKASRLILTNDSIVGPLNQDHFDLLIQRIRNSNADVIGLTECLAPRRHLQSFFLVFNCTAIKHDAVHKLLSKVLNLSTKSQVIDIYETHLTSLLDKKGLKCEVMFPSLSNDPYSSNDVFLRWIDLIELGFPYVKTSIIRSSPNNAKILAYVPDRYRDQ